MRSPTPQEVERWIALARDRGGVDEEGRWLFGQVVDEGWDRDSDSGGWRLHFRVITPFLADVYTDDLRPKTPPILFERTAAGEVMLPWRWWQRLFERMSESSRVAEAFRRLAAGFAREAKFSDVLLPATTDTIEVYAPDETGGQVAHEALPPGTLVTLYVPRRATNKGG